MDESQLAQTWTKQDKDDYGEKWEILSEENEGHTFFS